MQIAIRSDGTPLVVTDDGKKLDADTVRAGINAMSRTLFEQRNMTKGLHGQELLTASVGNHLLSAKLERYKAALHKLEQRQGLA